MATKLLPITENGSETARLENDELVLDGFRERDKQVVALAEDADSIALLVHDLLVIGGRAMTAAQATTDVAVVEKAFDAMKDAFDRDLEAFAEELATKTTEFLDEEDGALPRSFEGFTQKLEELLGDTFDPDSKKSAIAAIEEVMRKNALEQLKAMRALIDPDNDVSPLSRYRGEIVKTVEKETGKLQKALDELRTQLAVDEAKAEMFELTTKKGFTYEDELEAALIEICQPHGDLAERVGGTPGARGKKGDFKVSLNPDDVAGQDVCFTMEAKNQHCRLKDILKELDGCVTNRGALAGVAVFAKQEQCPGGSPFQFYGNRALVVYDPGDGNNLALRLSVAWARWVVRRQLAAGGDSIDLDRIGSLIEAARQALRTQKTIDRALTTSANKITEAKGHLNSLVNDVEEALLGIEGEVAA
jgi:hypothetical protein